MAPTAPHQKNLIIAVTTQGIHSATVGKVASWILPRDETWAWLEDRRPLLPRASSQELVSLALLPEDLRYEMAAVMCGMKLGSAEANSPDLKACSRPHFETYTETSALCVVALLGYQAKGLAANHRRACEMLGAQIDAALPFATRAPDGFINEHATRADSEAALLALRDQKILVAQSGRAPSRPAPKPRL